MFYRKKFRKLQELYNSLNQDYLKLRRDYWSLAEELENLQNQDKDLKILDLELTIKKLSKELINCKKIVNAISFAFWWWMSWTFSEEKFKN